MTILPNVAAAVADEIRRRTARNELLARVLSREARALRPTASLLPVGEILRRHEVSSTAAMARAIRGPR